MKWFTFLLSCHEQRAAVQVDHFLLRDEGVVGGHGKRARIAGALSAAFGCTLMAPHGGIFVFPVVDHPLLYLVALAAGTVATAVILGLVKGSKS